MTIDSIKASDNLAATCYFQVPVKEREKSKGKHIFIRQSHGHMKSSNLTTIWTAKIVTRPYRAAILCKIQN